MGTGSIRTLVRGLQEVNPGLRIVGLTATPYRLSQGYLTQKVKALFTSICYRVDVASLIAQGHLAPLVTGAVGAQIDTEALTVRAGEFALRDLELAADVATVTERVADDVALALDAGRTSALLFGWQRGARAPPRRSGRCAGARMVIGDGPDGAPRDHRALPAP